MSNTAPKKVEFLKSVLVSPCGLVCSRCDAYRATQENDPEKLEMVAADWRKIYACDEIKAEHLLCDGCMSASERKCGFCTSMCEIHRCAAEKKISVCSECPGYPCDKLDAFIKSAPEGQGKAMRNLLNAVVEVERNMHSIF